VDWWSGVKASFLWPVRAAWDIVLAASTWASMLVYSFNSVLNNQGSNLNPFDLIL
jgi:hypothetical protein